MKRGFSLNKEQYRLVFVFDKKSLNDEEDVKDRIRNITREYQKFSIKYDSLANDSLKVALKADGDEIDACHNQILQQFNSDFVIRLEDELGEEIRNKFYPAVSKIEQKFRELIQHACIQAGEVDWWGELAPPRLRERVNGVRERRNEQDCHPLKLLSFRELVILTELPDWPQASSLTVGQLDELLSQSSSLKELKNNFESKANENLWNKVLHRYFKSKEEWQYLKGEINSNVIDLRNKIAHNRAILLYEADKLYREKEKILKKLNSAKETDLSPEELKEVQKEKETLTSFVKNTASTIAAHYASQTYPTMSVSGPIPANVVDSLRSTNIEPTELLADEEDDEDNDNFDELVI